MELLPYALVRYAVSRDVTRCYGSICYVTLYLLRYAMLYYGTIFCGSYVALRCDTSRNWLYDINVILIMLTFQQDV